ncbi:MAG: DUF1501 domain-containing protein [Planctomycetaceae bacterium]
MDISYMNNGFSRRELLKTTSAGFGMLALAGLCADEAAANPASGNPLAPKQPHHPPKAKRVIFMFMRGGPSHVDTFDHKPMLAKRDGQSATGGPYKNQRGRKLMKSPWKFRPRGKSGIEISDLFPHLSKQADDLCLLNGMHTDLPNHPQAVVQMHTGSFAFVRPSMGSWIVYGLGTESQNLPGFITINPPTRLGGAQNYGSAFLPAMYEGTRIGTEGRSVRDAKVPYITNSKLTTKNQRRQLDLLQAMNRDRLQQDRVNTQLEGLIESYELAFRMQSAVPKIMDLTSETSETMRQYGIGERQTDNFGRQCLMARRLAEAGVRFIEISHSNWDQHNGLRSRLTANCTAIDKPISALIADLRQRGMLEETLIVWGGEFGRTPHVRRNDGRDHNSTGFSMFMAGGGVKGGIRYGKTDENGIAAVEDKVHIHDLHATILHLMGLNHEKLTYRYSGRDFRLTDVHGRVVREIFA